MVYTVTFNPCLDYAVGMKQFRMGEVNRTDYEKLLPGGKGINVSQVLTNLGVDNLALGFVAGFTGGEIVRMLEAYGCKADFIEVEGVTRINVILKSERETNINARGPEIPLQAQERLLRKLESLPVGSILVLAGSIPHSLPPDTYENVLERLAGHGVRAVVDATGELLARTLPYSPFLIKPNVSELEELTGERLETEEKIVSAVRRLQERGAQNVLVSRGGKGAILASETGEVFSRPAPEGRVVNAVGAGDSMVAGFLAGYIRGLGPEAALKLGLAAGSASAFSEGLATKDEIDRLLAAMA